MEYHWTPLTQEHFIRAFVKAEGCSPGDFWPWMAHQSWHTVALSAEGLLLGVIMTTAETVIHVWIAPAARGAFSLKKFRIFWKFYAEHQEKTLETYILKSRPEIARLAKICGFTITDIGDFYYGQYPKSPGSGTSTPTSPTSHN